MTLVECGYGALLGLALGRAPPPPRPAVPVCEPKSWPRIFVEPTTIAVAETIPVVSVVGLCDLSNVMPAANPPPASTSAAAIPITICGAFISKPLCSLLLISKCLDRMQSRRAHCGVEPEDDSDRDRNADRDDHRAARNEKRQARRLRNLVDDESDRPAEQDADHPAETRERHRLDEELIEDVS